MTPHDAVATRRRRGGHPPAGAGGSRHRAGRLAPPDPGMLRCMVLACTPDDTTAVDMHTGALVRLRIDWGEGRQSGPVPFDVVDVTLAADPQRDDLAHPEAVSVHGLPSVAGRLRRRRARRVLRYLVVPNEPELLGFPGPSAPYWEFRGMRPSLAVIVPTRGPQLIRRYEDDTVWARFGWSRSDQWLPVEDSRAIAALWAMRRDRLSGRDLATALGFRPQFLVVALSRPRDGHCYKTVVALLPRP